MNDFIHLVAGAIGAILCTMSAIYVSCGFVESMKEYFKDQSIYNLFMTSVHATICLIILIEVTPLIILFMERVIL